MYDLCRTSAYWKKMDFTYQQTLADALAPFIKH